MITIKIGHVPGTIKEYALNGTCSVKSALEQSNVTYAGFEVRRNGITVDAMASTYVQNGDTLLLVKKVKSA